MTSISAALRFTADVLLDAIAPAACAACDAPPLLRRAVFCPSCASTVERSEGAIDGARLAAFGLYGGALAIAVRRFKYQGRSDLAKPLASLLARVGAPPGADLVVPVPMHPRRLAERGYNHASLLARAYAGIVDLPSSPRGLARLCDTPRQATLDRAGRLANVEGVFVAPRRAAIEGRSVVLVDDVASTGATIKACTAALFASGAARVTALVLAHNTA